MSEGNTPIDTKTVRLNKPDLKVRYAELGDSTNPPVLLLHGVPENLQAWYAVAPLLAEKYHVLALDWPGFGGSDPLASPEDYTSRRFAEVIVDFMDSLHIRQASLIATDIALLPSLLVGLKHPSRVSKLVVMDGIPFPRPQYSSWELKSFAKKGSILGKALVRWFPRVTAQISYLKGFYRGHSIPTEVRQEFLTDGLSKSNQEAFLSYFQNFRTDQEYFEPRAHELQTPVLVVWGKYDRFISSKLGHEIAEKLPNAKLEVIDKSGHYVHMDTPKELVQVVIRFLGEEAVQTNVSHTGKPPKTVGDTYRFEHFTLPLMFHDARFSRDSLAPGDVLPNQTLTRTDGTQTDLRAVAADRPLVLIVGSVSCPMTTSSLPRLVELEQKYGEQLNFALIYAREAHPGENYRQAQTLEEKVQYARELEDLHGVSWPVLVDDLDGTVHRLLDTKPNSVHIVSRDGTILFRSLFASDGGVEDALQAIAAGEEPRNSQGTARIRPALVAGGYISDALGRSGRSAYLDVLKSAPPLALLGTVSKGFPWLEKTKRGFAAVAVLVAAPVAAIALLW